ncbi:PilN domain-containing protein [Providencia vermicola]|uniref:PilN domain-containing protein n=1 Tax=Providencia vermicola TaxID=333965 RepID=UPI0034D77A59
MYQVNFLPWRQQKMAAKKRYCVVLCLFQSFFVIVCMIYFSAQQQLELQQRQITKTQLTQQVTHNQHHIQLVTEKQIQLTKWQRYQESLARQAQRNSLRLSILHKLPELTPPKSWLAHFSLTDKHFEIAARSYDPHDIHQLITRLENSPLLQKIQLIKMERSEKINYLHLSANYLEGTDE